MNTIVKSAELFLMLSVVLFTACFDDSPVEYNEYIINDIITPVPATGSLKKVHIGHDLPVNVTIEARYDEKGAELPLQYYLLHAGDVAEVEKGIGDPGDIRMYYCHRSDFTTVKDIISGENTYGTVINIPADEAVDEFTGDYKTGEFYVVAEANKYEDAEIDAFAVYEKFSGSLGSANKVEVTTEYRTLPDLSVESMSFTGGSDEPSDVLVMYNLYLKNLPGGNSLPVIYVKPSLKDRTFTGTVTVRSSSSDALNVPLVFSLRSSVWGEGAEIPLEIYDKSIGGWVTKFYIPLLRANSPQNITLNLRIPEDSGADTIFSGDSWWSSQKYGVDSYPLSNLRYLLGEEGYGEHEFKIHAKVNDGSVKESRFIVPDGDNRQYSESDYCTGGDCALEDNNVMNQPLVVKLEKIEVEPNSGINLYPYVKLDPPDEDYKTLVIFWDGIEFNVGNSTLGASAGIHEGMFFYNYSLYSLGVDIHGTVFNNNYYLVNTYLKAEAHPFQSDKSYYDFHIEAARRIYLDDTGQGFLKKTWNYPVLLYGKEFQKEQWYYCFKFKIILGIETYFTPGINLEIKKEGDLRVDKYAELVGSAYGDASAGIAGLASLGLYTYVDVLTLALMQSCYTVTSYDEVNYKNKVRGTLNRTVEVYLIGPKGHVDLYFEIDFLVYTKRWSKEILNFYSFKMPLVEFNINEPLTTNYNDLGGDAVNNYETPESRF